MSSDGRRSVGDTGRVFSYVLAWLALTAMLVLAPFYLAAGLLAPLWAVVVLVVVWLALFALAIILLIRRRPWWVVPIPVLAAMLWWLVVSLGERFLGWTA